MVPERPTLDVSAIVIARNEEGNIVECLDAVFRALQDAEARGMFRSHEVVLVDSASSDRTVELALKFPITIARLRRTWPLSASAGKFTGARLARGSVLLFVDGDYFLDSRWLLRAWDLLRERDVGAVCGWDLEEISGTTVLAKRWKQTNVEGTPETEDVDSVASGLVKREAYEAVGGLHPFLRGAEDRDLGLRLRERGWRVLRTREPMGRHRWARPGEPFTYVDYYRSVAVWSLGDGQACRTRWRDRRLRMKFFARYATARHLIQALQLNLVVLFMLGNLACALLGLPYAVALLPVDFTAAAVFLEWKRRNGWEMREGLFELQAAIYGPYRQLVFAIGLLRGSQPPETYPTDVEIVQRESDVARPTEG